MFKRIRSALFIDFENMPLARDSIENWLAWLEDGGFDGNKRRKFLLKRVYWNSGVQKFKSAYEARGFEVMLCDRYHGLANSVDVQMAIDIIEATYEYPRIDEYILITRDTDFVPVLKRLREKQKRTAFMVNEAKLNVHTTYHQHADVLIPVRTLEDARRYERKRRGLLALLGGLGRAKASTAVALEKSGRRVGVQPAMAAPAMKPSPSLPVAAKPLVIVPRKPRKPAVKHELPNAAATARALEYAIRLASALPDRPTSRARMIEALQGLPEFSTSGRSPFLGFVDYKGLMQELCRLDPRLAILDQPGGGIVVRFTAPVAPATTATTEATAESTADPSEDAAVGPASEAVA